MFNKTPLVQQDYSHIGGKAGARIKLVDLQPDQAQHKASFNQAPNQSQVSHSSASVAARQVSSSDS